MTKTTPAQFENVLNYRIGKIKEVLGSKSEEYAFNGDSLFNFRCAARINGVTMEQAVWGMATKHLVAIIDIVNGRTPATRPVIDEQIGDMINYLILLEAAAAERLWNQSLASIRL